MGQEILRFPLFPLGLVLLPGEALPLHIFEERYKLMIGECLDEDREFGVIWLADDALKDVGCAAEIVQVLERFEDGRLNILVKGTTPFRLERRIGELAYPAGDLTLLEDEPASDDAALEQARERYADLVEEVTDERPPPEALAELDAYGMAATLEIAAGAKQELLELRSEPARLEQLAGLFAEALKRIKTAARVAEQASGNGHLKPGE
jgi:Lon protease-like protein